MKCNPARLKVFVRVRLKSAVRSEEQKGKVEALCHWNQLRYDCHLRGHHLKTAQDTVGSDAFTTETLAFLNTRSPIAIAGCHDSFAAREAWTCVGALTVSRRLLSAAEISGHAVSVTSIMSNKVGSNTSTGEFEKLVRTQSSYQHDSRTIGCC